MIFNNSVTFEMFDSLRMDCFPDETIDRIAFENNILRDNYIFAIIDHKLAGYILSDSTTSIARIIHVCVDKLFRGRGIGTKLVNQLIMSLKEKRTTQLQLIVDQNNQEAIQFYKKLNFQINSSQYQYRHDYTNDEKRNYTCKIELVSDLDIDNMISQFKLGESIVNYFIESHISIFYKIMDQNEQIIGYFVYDSISHLISHFYLSKPEYTYEVITVMQTVISPKTSIRINFQSDEIELYLDESIGNIPDYKLYVMTKNLNQVDMKSQVSAF